jgi:hypothetical protein
MAGGIQIAVATFEHTRCNRTRIGPLSKMEATPGGRWIPSQS